MECHVIFFSQSPSLTGAVSTPSPSSSSSPTWPSTVRPVWTPSRSPSPPAATASNSSRNSTTPPIYNSLSPPTPTLTSPLYPFLSHRFGPHDLLCTSFTLERPSNRRVLVLLDDFAVKSSHSLFFNSLKSRGFDLHFHLVNDPQFQILLIRVMILLILLIQNVIKKKFSEFLGEEELRRLDVRRLDVRQCCLGRREKSHDVGFLEDWGFCDSDGYVVEARDDGEWLLMVVVRCELAEDDEGRVVAERLNS
ncbi:hypothetical protein VIGAN_01357000 [Vigna angularis var. angularis]|uniref:Uncharacterized protein n=1 Tax=Vigna angularis var. angularis TaxID=157739 RepID=A0A0S3R4W0_PHAAN|nr:hypothetical protein VIGAN_01357000 [Vigna angularis var. angularis]